MPFTPANAGRARRLQQAQESFKYIGKLEIDKGEELPAGVTDLLSYWESEKASAENYRQELDSPDPFVAARALYLGGISGSVQPSAIGPEKIKLHWPLRMVSLLLFPDTRDSRKDHFVSLLSTASDIDGNLLQCAIACTPDSYNENSARLKQLQPQGAASLSYHLLNILVNFQDVFLDKSVIDEEDGAKEKGAIEVENVNDADLLKF